MPKDQLKKMGLSEPIDENKFNDEDFLHKNGFVGTGYFEDQLINSIIFSNILHEKFHLPIIDLTQIRFFQDRFTEDKEDKFGDILQNIIHKLGINYSKLVLLVDHHADMITLNEDQLLSSGPREHQEYICSCDIIDETIKNSEEDKQNINKSIITKCANSLDKMIKEKLAEKSEK